ncbi:MAG: flagellar brake domain-containing protein [Desulfovibrionaceae bacterium]
MDQHPYAPEGAPQVKRQACTHFSIDMGVPATLAFPNQSHSMHTVFVGLDRDAYIGLRLPETADPTLLCPGAALTVHYQHGGRVCCFETSVIDTATAPFPVLYVAVPQAMDLSDMREEARVNSFMPATTYCLGRELKSVVLNISLLGSRILLDPEEAKGLRLEPGIEVFVRVTFMGMPHELYLHGILKNVSRFKEKTVIGIAFGNLSSEVMHRLGEYVNNLMELQEI